MGIQQFMNEGCFMVEHASGEEQVATLEIPYNPLQIPVSSNSRVPMVIPSSVAPLVIIVPSPFHFESTKVVPWNYNSDMYIYRQKQEKLNVASESAIDIVGTVGITRIGRIFASAPSPEKDDVEAAAKSK